MLSILARQILGQSAADLVQDLADQRFVAGDVGWRDNEVERAVAVADNARLDHGDTRPRLEPMNGLHAGALAATQMGSTAGRDLA